MSSFRIARCGLCVALLAVASCITIPFGPVPFTLQTLAVAMLPVALGGRDATISVAIYLLLGGLGLPVFSGFSGGVAVLAGPTGGFLWGFLAGTACSIALERAGQLPERLREVLSAAVMLLVSYAWGTAQLMLVMQMALPQALALAVVPFVIPDVIKLAAGIQVGRAVRRALRVQRA